LLLGTSWKNGSWYPAAKDDGADIRRRPGFGIEEEKGFAFSAGH
jgi:hypothetical protein